MLMCEYCPLTEDDNYYEQPSSRRTHMCVTEQSDTQSLFSQSVKNTPGPDMLSYRDLRLAREWDKERIGRLTKVAIRIGRPPEVWMCDIGVVIRKPGKDNKTMVTAYRSMSLLSPIGKVVEKVLTELLSEKANGRGLLSGGQLGSREGRSAIDAVAIMVNGANAA